MSDMEFVMELDHLIKSTDFFTKNNGRPDGTLHFDDDVMDLFEGIQDVIPALEDCMCGEMLNAINARLYYESMID